MSKSLRVVCNENVKEGYPSKYKLAYVIHDSENKPKAVVENSSVNITGSHFSIIGEKAVNLIDEISLAIERPCVIINRLGDITAEKEPDEIEA